MFLGFSGIHLLSHVHPGLLVKAILEELTKAATNADPKKMMMYSAVSINPIKPQLKGKDLFFFSSMVKTDHVMC